MRATITPMRATITIDVEGDFGTDRLRGLDEVVPRLLDGFAEHDVVAVFFVVAEVARQRPKVIQGISEAGHVIGSHSLDHTALSRIGPERLATQLKDSRAILEDLSGRPCHSFRAPYFDLPRRIGPALEEAGYRWSSSKAPFSPIAKYRHLFATQRPHQLRDSSVWEFPVPRILGLPIPAGLSYRRLFWPLSALSRRPPSVFYLHPYELLDEIEDWGALSRRG